MITKLWRGLATLAVILLLWIPSGEAEAEMASGTGGTLNINPTGLSSLTMDLTGGGPAGGTTPYIVPLQTLDLNVDRRWRHIYDEAPPGEGGAMTDEYGPLVPISFWVIIKSATRAGMITAYNDLAEALMNRKGGTIQYKPEDVGAGALDTYYHYVPSPPPEIVQRPGNRWDAGAKSDGMYTLTVAVEFQTQPIATSDPDNPVTLTELSTTLQNYYYAADNQTNKVQVSASNLKGSMPALLRILARPGSDQKLARLIIFTRSEGAFATFINTLDASFASEIYPSSAWTLVEDQNGERGATYYYRCLPPEEDNEVAQGLRFTISNPEDYEGRFAVFGIGYDDADDVDGVNVWTHQVRLRVGNVIQAGKDTYYAGSHQNWRLIFAGEFELPIDTSDLEPGYDTGPYLEWYATRNSGTSEFRLDGLLLVYVTDSDLVPTALDVPCEDEEGVTNSEYLLVENFPGDGGIIGERAHAIAQSDYDLKRVFSDAPRGDFITLNPNLNHLLVFVQEQWTGTVLEDDFSSYEGHRWAQTQRMEDDSEWTEVHGTALDDSTNFIEGDQGIEQTTELVGAQNIAQAYDTITDWDLTEDGRITNDDYACIALYLSSGDLTDLDSVEMRLATEAGSYYAKTVQDTELAEGWNYLALLRSTFASTGSPAWSHIRRLYLLLYSDSAGTQGTWDHWRFEKADPDDANEPNPTGSVWNFQPTGGAWAITEDVTGAGATLACLDTEAGVEKVALIDEFLKDMKFRARVLAKDAGYVGIVWMAGEDTLTEGAEDCYMAFIDTAEDQLEVWQYTNGVQSGGVNDFTCDVDTWYTLAVIQSGIFYELYATASSNLSDDDDIFDDQYLIQEGLSYQLTSGYQGVVSISTLGRFDEVKLMDNRDKHLPSDEITLQGCAIFRTIAPFME